MSNSPARKIADNRLNSYRATPTDIRGHYNREQANRQGYCKRPLLELLQNIEDALKDSEANPPQAAFILRDSTLFVLNKGTPFTERGFQALCDSDDSPKHGEGFIGSKGTGFKAVLNWTKTPEIHSCDIHACFDRNEAEQQIREAIGNDTYESLKEEGGWQGQAPLLRIPLEKEPDDLSKQLLKEWTTVVKLSLKVEAVDDVRNALEEFDPVNLLFLRHLSAVHFDVDGGEWCFSRKPLSDTNKEGIQIQSIELCDSRNTASAVYRLHRKALDDISPLDEKDKGDCEIAVAFRKDDLTAEGPGCWFNFFPIHDAPAPVSGVILHATFLLKPDREALREDGPDYHNQLAEKVADLLVEELLPEMREKHGPQCLGLLKPRNDGTEHVQKLNRKIQGRIADAKFVPDIVGKLVAPNRLWLYDEDLGALHGHGEELCATVLDQEDERRLCHPGWQSGYSEILESYGAKGLSALGHLHTLRPFRPCDLDAALGVLALAVEKLDKLDYYQKGEAKNIVADMPVWLCDDGQWRALNAGAPLVESLPPGLKDEKLPHWLRFHCLDNAFLESVKKKDQIWSKLAKLFDPHVGGQPQWLVPKDKHKFAARVLLPALEQKQDDSEWWRRGGPESLNLVYRLGFGAEAEDVWRDPMRRRLGEVVRVPVHGAEWRPARKVYAGEGWYDGEPAWGEVLAKLPDRFLLAEPEAFGCGEKNKWVSLLRYLGVSWMPKLICFNKDLEKASVYQLASHNPDIIQRDRWQSYIRSCVTNALGKDYCKELETYVYEGLEELIATFSKSNVDILRLLESLHRISGADDRKTRTYWRREGPEGGQRDILETERFHLWQLKFAPLFHVDRSEAVLANGEWLSAQELFLDSGTGWKAWLPRLELGGVRDENERDRLKLFASEALGVLRRVDDAPEEQWLGWLECLRQWCGKLNAEQRREWGKHLAWFTADLVQSLRKKEEGGQTDRMLKDICLPCETRDGIEFSPPNEAYVLDEHKWEPLRRGLIEEGKNLLLVSLNRGKQAAELFGCKHRLLSRALEASLMENLEEDTQAAEAVRALLRNNDKMARTLALIEHSSGEEKARELRERLSGIEIRAIKELKICPRLEERRLDPVPVEFHWENERLWLDGRNQRDNLAHALCHQFKLKDNMDDALANLFGKLDGETLDNADNYLRHKGIDEQAVERWMDRESPDLPTLPQPPIPSGNGDKKPDAPIEPSGASTPSSGAPTGGKPSGGKTEKGPNPSPTGADAAEAGRKAEEVVLGSLQKMFGAERVRDVSKEHMDDRECDIIVVDGEDRECLIEVKSVKSFPGSAFWTESEVETAKKHDVRYVAAFVHDGEVRWVQRPLQALKPKQGYWIWPEKRKPVPLDQESWELPRQRPTHNDEPERFHFEVEVSEEVWKKLSQECPIG